MADGNTTTWCVYRKEFVSVHVSRAVGSAGREECVRVFHAEYRRKVVPNDWRLREVSMRQPPAYRLELKLFNLKGEYKDKGEAQRVAGRQWGRDVWVVQWGSPEEQQLLDYGVKQLSTARQE